MKIDNTIEIKRKKQVKDLLEECLTILEVEKDLHQTVQNDFKDKIQRMINETTLEMSQMMHKRPQCMDGLTFEFPTYDDWL